MSDSELRERAQQLYALDPGRFTPRRTELVRAARAAGDRDLAGRLQRLRRPTVAAWAVNLLARERPDLVGELTTLGASLRQAQAHLQGDALRELTRQRRRLVAGVAREVRRLAEDRGQPMTEATLRQVEDTLQAALVDPGAAGAVATGMLTQALASTGVESLADVVADVPALTALTDHSASAAPDGAGRPLLRVVDGARDDTAERLAEARKAARKAAKRRQTAERKHAQAEAKVLQVEAGIEELRRQLVEAEARAEEAADKVTRLQAAVEEATAESADATTEVQRLEQRSGDIS